MITQTDIAAWVNKHRLTMSPGPDAYVEAFNDAKEIIMRDIISAMNKNPNAGPTGISEPVLEPAECLKPRETPPEVEEKHRPPCPKVTLDTLEHARHEINHMARVIELYNAQARIIALFEVALGLRSPNQPMACCDYETIEGRLQRAIVAHADYIDAKVQMKAADAKQ